MTSLAFVTHPSVRIKGTENNYTPSQCLDERCPVKAPHLHCPFCVKTDAYQDPVILKAHYRVKHVDKGIEFAGLKILRCCDQCDIIGIIKGEKRFKGAHWHCYRCRNGFNRRDEAIKHYKTHFRNPQTTFQIQITQDLNSPPDLRTHDDHNTGQDAFASIENPVQEIIHPALSQSGINLEQNVITSASNVGSRHVGTIQKVKVKHELLGKEDSGDHEDEETIMIIQGEQLESAFASHIINSGELTALNKASVDPNLTWEIRYRMEEEEKNMYKSKAEEYKAQVELLQQQVANLENQLAQQGQIKLHELLDNLSGDGNKQGLSQQLTKFLEQCQLQTSQGTITVIEDESQTEVPQPEQLESTEHIINGLEHNARVLSDQLETAASVDPNATVSHLSEIPEGFQVIGTTSEGHVVVTRASEAAVTPAVAEGATIVTLENPASSSPAVVSAPSAVSEIGQALFPQVIDPQTKVTVIESVAADDQTYPSSEALVNAGDIPQTNLADVASTQSCLMEVVTAADGLTTLGTTVDAAPTTGVSEKENENEKTYIMDIEDGEKILVQSPNENLQLETENAISTEPQQDEEEPEPKKTKRT